MSQLADVKAVRPSRTNPRKTFPDDAELVASIGEHGILEDLLVRTHAEGGYELIDGERRWRAGVKAGVSQVPIKVMELDDRAMLEIQLVKTVQRADVHPVEEADGYAELEKMGHEVSAIAEKVSKSESYIRETMQLASLTPAAKKFYLDGALSKTGAFKIARLPSKPQEAAIADLKRTHRQDEKQAFPVRVVDEVVARRYLPLNKAPFAIKDASLVPAAGACTTCDKNTGRQPEIFADVKTPTCTDFGCYGSKVEADWKKRAEAAAAAGQAVLSDKVAKSVFTQLGLASHDYVDLAKTDYDGHQMRPWREILGKDCPPAILARNPHTGEVHELVDGKEARAVRRRREEKRDRSKPAKGKKAKAVGTEDADRSFEIGQAAISELVARAEKRAMPKDALQTVLALLLNGSSLDLDFDAHFIWDRRGWGSEKANQYPEADQIAEHIRKLSPAQLAGLVYEVLLPADVWRNGVSLSSDLRKECKTWGVDLKKIEKLDRAITANSTQPAAPATAKKKGGRK